MKRILSSVLMLTLAACGGDDDADISQNTETLQSEAEPIGADEVDQGFSLRFASWPEKAEDGQRVEAEDTNVEAVEIDGSELVLTLRHGGGCQRHEYTVKWDGAFRESEPVQVSFAVLHDSNGDECRAILTSSLRVPLEPLRDAYRLAYAREGGSIVIQTGNAPEPVTDTF